jgi:hypothetical protein
MGRIWAGVFKAIKSMVVLTPAQAAARGINRATAQETRLKEALLRHLVQSVLGIRKLPPRYDKAIHTIAMFFNTTLVHWVTSKTPTRILDLGGDDISVEEVLSALKLILNRTARLFSEGRWGTSGPSFAYMTLWLVLFNLANLGMEQGFDKAKLERNRLKLISQAIDGKFEFELRLNTRISRTFAFTSPDSQGGYWTMLGSVTCHIHQAPLFLMLALDARRNPDVRKFAERFGLGQNLDDLVDASGDATRDGDDADDTFQDPPVLVMAKRKKMETIMAESCLIFAPEESARVPDHIEAFRRAYHSEVSESQRSDRIENLWRCTMPGLGRLWYSLIHTWSVFPLCLALLVCESVSEADKDHDRIKS